MIPTIAKMFDRMKAKQQKEAESTADAFRRLTRDILDGKLSPEQGEAALALTGRTLDDLNRHAAALAERRELAASLKAGEGAATELERIREAQGKATAAYHEATQRYEAAMAPLRAKASELEVVVSNGTQAAKKLEASAGKLDPDQLAADIAKREEVYVATEDAVAAAMREDSAVMFEQSRAMNSLCDESRRVSLKTQREETGAKLAEAMKPREAADAALRARKLLPEMV